MPTPQIRYRKPVFGYPAEDTPGDELQKKASDDPTYPSPILNYVLAWNGSEWVPTAPGGGGGAATTDTFIVATTNADLSAQVLMSAVIQTGTLASRPAASTVPAGSLYFATDSGTNCYRSDGATTWTAVNAQDAGALRAANNLSDVSNAATALGNLGGTTTDVVHHDMLPSWLGGDAQGIQTPQTYPASASGVVGGSLTGSLPNPTFSGRDASVDAINKDLLPGALLGPQNGLTAIPTQSPPTGPAGGSLGGTYPNPTFAGRDTSVDAINKDMLPAQLLAGLGAVAVLPLEQESGRATFGDAAYAAGASDRVIAHTGAITATRTVTLPACSALQKGTIVTVVDEGNTVTNAFNILIARAGADTINGGSVSAVISVPGGFCRLEASGTNWVILDQSMDQQIFTATGTWTKRPGYNQVRVKCVGGGGSGGSGDSGTSGAAGGGGGGAGGSVGEALFRAEELGATEAVTVGAQVAGGTAVTTAVGNIGTAGNNSTFKTGAHCQGTGGTAGPAGGTTATTAAAAVNGKPWQGSVGGIGNIAGAGGAGSPTTNLFQGLTSFTTGSGGGGGAAVTGAGTAGGAGGNSFGTNTVAAGGTAGGAGGGGAGNAGNSPTQPAYAHGAGGSGGGGGATTGGVGGAGGVPGGGGGGGGGAITGSASGAGGVGAAGIVIVVSFR